MIFIAFTTSIPPPFPPPLRQLISRGRQQRVQVAFTHSETRSFIQSSRSLYVSIHDCIHDVMGFTMMNDCITVRPPLVGLRMRLLQCLSIVINCH